MMIYARFGSFDVHQEPSVSYQELAKIFNKSVSTICTKINKFLEKGEVALFDGRCNNGLYKNQKHVNRCETGLWLKSQLEWLLKNDKQGEHVRKKLETLSVEAKCDFIKKNYGLDVSEANIQKVFQMRSLKGINEFQISPEDR